MRNVEGIEGVEVEDLARTVGEFAETMLDLGNHAALAGMRDVEITARDAAEGLLALLDVLAHRERTVPLRTI
ncbi:hypothetical protein [Methylobacterium sp. Leaf466]|uniref:hypothetical protein n=1 Tax=Methylobacterium sp. Leaf466 TaxID=1736386 RepID=UPI0007019825|nr:hypothetical protein [Methylobacterium sp. Leaf466]KQT81082.1 hypothetical protein ASG59_19395 [Methylobacterium sp. Leaf466]